MIVLFLIFLRVWFVGIAVLLLFTIKNRVVSKRHNRDVIFWKGLIYSQLWPFLLLSAEGRMWFLSTINVK